MLAGDKFIQYFHLTQPIFTYSTCITFTKHRARIKKFRQTSILNHIYENKLDKACFAMRQQSLIVKNQLRELFRQDFER